MEHIIYRPKSRRFPMTRERKTRVKLSTKCIWKKVPLTKNFTNLSLNFIQNCGILVEKKDESGRRKENYE